MQKLTAIESLAGVDMLCSDKTGTLTANKLSLNEPYVSPGEQLTSLNPCLFHRTHFALQALTGTGS